MMTYDEFLSFDLSEDYAAVSGKTDDGIPSFTIQSGKKVNDDGEEQYSLKAVIKAVPDEAFSIPDGSVYSLDGKAENYITVSLKQMSALIFTMDVYTAMVFFRKDGHVYVIASPKVSRMNDPEDFEGWITFLNTILHGAVLNGEKIFDGEITAERLKAAAVDADEAAAAGSGYPVATPLQGQHTHLDFLKKSKAGMSIFGGLINVNASGTEYEFYPVSSMIKDEGEGSSERDQIFQHMIDADHNHFDLAETAFNMAELFRVKREAFDPGHDREQDILNGLIHRASMYNKLRSFAWTLCAYCDREHLEPVDLNIDMVQDLVAFVTSRGDLNYKADSYSPVLCSGDDIHVYYVPDMIPESEKAELLRIESTDTAGKSAAAAEIRSLDGVRRELEYIYPPIRRIYDQLEKDRDPEIALTGDMADILYAWCSMTYAARNPFYSEDGPMNCWWEHPDDQIDWELKMQTDMLKNAIACEKDWLRRHENDITRNPHITINGNTFVFAGVESLDEWLDILKELTQKGGLHRTGVSGKTNYLVCNPAYAGDSQVRHALEQQIKGKDVKIVLFEDFLKELKMTVKSPQEKLAELEEKSAKKPKEKKLREIGNPSVPDGTSSKDPENLTYDTHLQSGGDDYTIDIPDGFVIKKHEEERDFIAYIPDNDDPDNYLKSRFIIFAGKKIQNETFGQLRTPAEYEAVVQGITAVNAAFAECGSMEYPRKDLPGAIFFGYEWECLHANAYFGINEYLQAMRVQINHVERKDLAAYKEMVKSLFDHMRTDKPVQLLQDPDADKYIRMELGTDLASEWVTLVGDYINHLTIARTIQQSSIVQIFKSRQSSGNASVAELKKDLREMLRSISRSADSVLKKVEIVYTLKRAEYPGHSQLSSLREMVISLAEFADQSVNLDGQQIRADSEFAAQVRARLDGPLPDAVAQLVQMGTDQETGRRLSKALEENAKAIQEEKEKEEREKEKKAAEEKAERERIETERKEAAEKARREAEEREAEERYKKLKAEEARKKYRIEHEEWKQKCREIRMQRAAEIEKRTKDERARLEGEARQKKESMTAAMNTLVSEQTGIKSEAESVLSSLGFFKFSEKSRQKAIIQEAAKKITEAEAAIKKAEEDYQNEIAAISSRISEMKMSIEKQVLNALPFPAEPRDPDGRQMTATQAENMNYKEAILDYLSLGGRHTITEIMENVPEISGVSNQRVSALIRQMVSDGLIIRDEIRRMAYFSIS